MKIGSTSLWNEHFIYSYLFFGGSISYYLVNPSLILHSSVVSAVAASPPPAPKQLTVTKTHWAESDSLIVCLIRWSSHLWTHAFTFVFHHCFNFFYFVPLLYLLLLSKLTLLVFTSCCTPSRVCSPPTPLNHCLDFYYYWPPLLQFFFYPIPSRLSPFSTPAVPSSFRVSLPFLSFYHP